jgi:two-component system, NarL family, sensor kinase
MAIPNLHELIDAGSLTYHLENTPFGVMLWDANMKLIYCSKEAAAKFGCAPHDLLEKPINLLQFVHEDDAPSVAKLITDITSGHTSHNESLNRNLSLDGSIIYCQWYNSALKDEHGKVVNILSLFQDVTSQIETQVALKKSQQQLSLAFNSAIDPMWLIRVEEPNIFRFETINHAFTKVTGWTSEQVEGQPIEKIMPASSHELVRGKYSEALASGKIIDYVEEAQHPSGVKYGEIRVIPIRGEAGEPFRILGIANDITEKVYLQKKLDAEHEIRSRQITSAAIKGQESERAKVSRELHDNVNQVLTTVKLYIELCMDQKIDTAAILPKCAAYLDNTINEIRHLSKQLSAPSLGNMNFKETLTDLIESLRTSTQIDVHIEFGTLSFLELESDLHLTIYRLAQEQFTNIIKYAKANRVDVSLKEEKSVLRFTIMDDGIGFDLSQKRQGIGITNMQSRVEILNGRFTIVSSPGKGTKLEVEIPIIIDNKVCYAEQTVLHKPVL